MLNPKRLIAVAAIATLLVAATPLAAELDGEWAGSGRGWCYSPDGDIMHPWQEWSGIVSGGSFDGDWSDSDGNVGIFEGSILMLSPVSAYCTGTWYWVSPDGTAPVEMGAFNMTFNYLDEDETCHGTWSTPDAATLGRMKGERIGD
jgi:hypothetical protein